MDVHGRMIGRRLAIFSSAGSDEATGLPDRPETTRRPLLSIHGEYLAA
jgi:hypothetical protein